MESSFAKWNVLRAATPWFRKGTAEEAKREQLKGRRAWPVTPTRRSRNYLPRSGL